FFQAEDGIRVFHVTGVQTCALPISFTGGAKTAIDDERSQSFGKQEKKFSIKTFGEYPGGPVSLGFDRWDRKDVQSVWIRPKKIRSEERRGGRECRRRGAASNV